MELTSTDLGADLEDWFNAHLDMQLHAQGRTSRARTEKAQQLIGHFWPAGLDYWSPLNPCFLVEFSGLLELNRAPSWMIRDGLIPLLWFFRNFPEPKGVRSRILIHEDFAAFVPPGWRGQTGTYEVVSISPESSGGRAAGGPAGARRLVLTGIGMDMFCSLSRLKHLLAGLKSHYTAAELRNLDVLSFVLGRFDGFGVERKHAYLTSYFQEIFKSLGTRLTPMEWGALESFPSLEGYDLLELNDRLVIADSFLTHLPLSRGATILGKRRLSRAAIASGERLVELSPYHAIRIRPKVSGKWAMAFASRTGDIAEFGQAFGEALRSDLNSRLPWPQWFGDWVRSSVWN